MTCYYSASQNTFLPVALRADYEQAGNWPQDAVEVEESVFTTYSALPPEGKVRRAGSDGLPRWVDAPLPPVETARNQKYTEVNQWRDVQENGSITFDWNGHRWDAGKASQDRLAPVLIVAKNGGLPSDFFWTDADNNDVPVTRDDLTAIDAGMTQTMVVQGFKIHERQRQMKKDIATLTSARDILNYPVGWPDNNGK
ncbi:DUF4376 domain-containing protein [Salmonella enterica subsp. enterica]|nr:DUF4376 domain-containing protein [Salmonella enterica subsp. enterica]